MTQPPTDLTFEQYCRASWQAYETVVRALLAGREMVTYSGLYLIRNTLVFGWWNQPESLPRDVQPRRRVLLNDVCVRMAEVKGWRRWPFPNDLLPVLQVPDHLGDESG